MITANAAQIAVVKSVAANHPKKMMPNQLIQQALNRVKQSRWTACIVDWLLRVPIHRRLQTFVGRDCIFRLNLPFKSSITRTIPLNFCYFDYRSDPIIRIICPASIVRRNRLLDFHIMGGCKCRYKSNAIVAWCLFMAGRVWLYWHAALKLHLDTTHSKKNISWIAHARPQGLRNAYQESSFYAHWIARRHRNYCRPDFSVVACRTISPRSGAAGTMHK